MMPSPTGTRLLPLAVLALLASGCECGVPVGSRGDASVDAPRRRPTDECGNGLDDDGNGRIDDGCPCGPGETQSCFGGPLDALLGVCMRGTQTCVPISGSEWGDWGESSCEGDVLPASTEACDGADDDCDGATDEGCPCDEGDTRPCGDEFVVAPCMAGTQTCRAGEWSTCEGAVGPVAEVCGDAVDNDCDGTTDDPVLCECIPEAEICRDAIDNDCDGETDEIECTPDWPRDAGVPIDAPIDAGLPPPEGCPTLGIPDFRDRIVWETVLPNAYVNMVNIGGHAAARLSDDTVTIELARLLPGTYGFGSEMLADEALGYLDFADGTPLTHHAWPGPGRDFDVAGGHLAVAGTFVGALDVGAGAWTSDPTEYSTGGSPPSLPAPDFYLVSGATLTGDVAGGRHFARTGIPAHPMPGSFFPTSYVFATSVDTLGNVYLAGRFQGHLDLDGHTLDSSPVIARNDWGAFVASFTPAGAARWLVSPGIGTTREMAIDPSGRYVAVIYDALGLSTAPPDNRVGVELRDAATGTVLFRHLGSFPSGLDLLAVAVDAAGNVTVMGEANAAFTLGPLSVTSGRIHVSSFDRTGALLWSHELMTDRWPNDQLVRAALATTGTEVAMVLGIQILGTSPVSIQIGDCARTVPPRAWVRGDPSGRPMERPPATGETVQEHVVAVLDAATGAHRWSRLLDGDTSGLSLGIHPEGDLLVALHGGTYPIAPDYGSGSAMYASHVFRLRNH